MVDSTEGQNMYQHVVNSTTHKTAQVLVKNIPAKNLKIKVLNGSGGTGIAGKVKTILENYVKNINARQKSMRKRLDP